MAGFFSYLSYWNAFVVTDN